MALNSINTNIAAYFAQQNINHSNSMTSSSIARLSSGNRIVRASDDVAAMSVGTSLRTTVSTLRMALINASQGSSMLQVADGALGKIQDMLLRQKALATQATSGSLTATERGFLNQEFQNLSQEIDRLTTNTNFNGVNLLGGGLGTSYSLANSDALATSFATATADNTNAIDDATLAIEAILTDDGTVIGAAAATNIELVDSANAALADGAFLSVNSAALGYVQDFELSNIVHGVADAGTATLTATIGGVEFSGNVSGVAGGATFYLNNGTTRLMFTANADFDFTDAGTTSTSLNALFSDFEDTALMRTGTIDNVSFAGTGLTDITGGAIGVASIRTMSQSVDIGHFQYASNVSGATVITVQVNGETWTAAGVPDAIDGTTALAFEKGNGEALIVDLAGMTETLDIFVEATDRTLFINALNMAFSNAGSGVDFALGTEQSDSLRVQIDSASTTSLYNGQSLDITTIASAQTAGEALNGAIDRVTSIRADVGAMMSRFDFASANIEISLQNQDAARGVLLDTDIATESSAYATAQVQLQAGIAVLAQANLLPQNLLKLIG